MEGTAGWGRGSSFEEILSRNDDRCAEHKPVGLWDGCLLTDWVLVRKWRHNLGDGRKRVEQKEGTASQSF